MNLVAAVGLSHKEVASHDARVPLNRNPKPYPYHHIIRNSNRIRIACRGDKILSYPYPPRNMLSNLNSKAMDKISSYPSGLLEADVRAGSYRAPRVHSPERPSEWRQLENHLGPSHWAQLHHHWASPSDWRHSQCVGRPLWPNFADLEQFQNCIDFRVTAPFSQNKITRSFQRSVISKITYLIN